MQPVETAQGLTLSEVLDGLIEAESFYRQTVNAQNERTNTQAADARLKLMRMMRKFCNGSLKLFDDVAERMLKEKIDGKAPTVDQLCENEIAEFVREVLQ